LEARSPRKRTQKTVFGYVKLNFISKIYVLTTVHYEILESNISIIDILTKELVEKLDPFAGQKIEEELNNSSALCGFSEKCDYVHYS
jgi:hypothetical protein